MYRKDSIWQGTLADLGCKRATKNRPPYMTGDSDDHWLPSAEEAAVLVSIESMKALGLATTADPVIDPDHDAISTLAQRIISSYIGFPQKRPRIRAVLG